jgi:hypothetical protein
MFPPVRPVFVTSYEDSRFMQSYRRKTHNFRSIPDWAFDDDEVRRVIAAHVAILARVSFIPNDIQILRLLNRRAIKLLKKSQSFEWHQLARAAQRKGLPAYFAAVLYKSYRLGWDSVQCAQDLGVSPAVIRQTLNVSKNIHPRLEGTRIRRGYTRRKVLVPAVPADPQNANQERISEDLHGVQPPAA